MNFRIVSACGRLSKLKGRYYPEVLLCYCNVTWVPGSILTVASKGVRDFAPPVGRQESGNRDRLQG